MIYAYFYTSVVPYDSLYPVAVYGSVTTVVGIVESFHHKKLCSSLCIQFLHVPVTSTIAAYLEILLSYSLILR